MAIPCWGSTTLFQDFENSSCGKNPPISFPIIPPFQSQYIFISNFWIFKRSWELHLKGASMWFRSVSWPTNCPVNFSLFWTGQKKNWPVSETGQIFLSTLVIFLSSSDIGEWPIFKKFKSGQRHCPFSETDYFSFGWSKRNWLGNWLANKTDQNHKDAPIV